MCICMLQANKVKHSNATIASRSSQIKLKQNRDHSERKRPEPKPETHDTYRSISFLLLRFCHPIDLGTVLSWGPFRIFRKSTKCRSLFCRLTMCKYLNFIEIDCPYFNSSQVRRAKEIAQRRHKRTRGIELFSKGECQMFLNLLVVVAETDSGSVCMGKCCSIALPLVCGSSAKYCCLFAHQNKIHSNG